MNFKRKKGAILIITLWILAILTILSVGIAGRMGLELKLSGYYRDSMKALYLAKAGIERAVVEKESKDENPDADFLSESWANNEGLFKEQDPSHSYEPDEQKNSYYTVKYTYKESKEAEGVELYGIEDEASKINVKNLDITTRQQLINLLRVVCQIDETDAAAKVDALIDWIDTDSTVQGTSEDENSKYYPDMGSGYCKNRPLDSIEELLLVKGFEDPAILYGDKNQWKTGIIDYITIDTGEGGGKVNVNTAPKEVLEALDFTKSQALDIINYRNSAGETGGAEKEPIDDLSSLTNGTIPYTKPDETGNIGNIINYLTTTSTVFRINSYSKVNNVRKHINCVVKLSTSGLYEIKYWNEN